MTQTAPRPHPFPCSICGLLFNTYGNLFYCLKNVMDPFTVTWLLPETLCLIAASFLSSSPDAAPETFHEQCNLWKLFLKRDHKWFGWGFFVHFHPSIFHPGFLLHGDGGGLSWLIPPMNVNPCFISSHSVWHLFQTRVKIIKPPSGLCRFVVEQYIRESNVNTCVSERTTIISF